MSERERLGDELERLLDAPSTAVQFQQVLGGVKRPIGQRGDERHVLGARACEGDPADADRAASAQVADLVPDRAALGVDARRRRDRLVGREGQTRADPHAKRVVWAFQQLAGGRDVAELPVGHVQRRPLDDPTHLLEQLRHEREDALAFLRKQQASTQNHLFGSKEKYDLIEAFDKDWNGALPYTVLISSKGEVLYRHEGAIDPLEMKRLIVKSLKEDRFKD